MSIDTAYFRRNGLIELLNYLSKNINVLKSGVESIEKGSVDLPSIQTAIEDGSLTTINTKKIRVFAEQMMPTESNSMYFLQTDLNPSQVASYTANEYVWFRIADVGGNIPVGSSTFKFSYAVSATASVTGSDVIYAAQASWVDTSNTSESYGTAVSVTTTLDEVNLTKYKLSSQSAAITPGGTRSTDKSLYIKIYRDAVNTSDDYAANSKLIFVDIEFIMD